MPFFWWSDSGSFALRSPAPPRGGAISNIGDSVATIIKAVESLVADQKAH